MINLMSDTVTKPTKAMLKVMMNAEVGDDVFREDPTVRALEEKGAAMFGKEAALFCPSGTMTNQIAIKMHTQPLDEVVCADTSHIYRSEAGVYSLLSSVAIQTLPSDFGKITAPQIEAVIKPLYDWLPKTRLVVLENTSNIGGGNFYTVPEIEPVRALCTKKGLGLHLDGARIFNALTETKEKPLEVGTLFDSVSICLSKGLGAPVGSLLLGNQEFIQRARRFRKAIGGGMRQAGYLAAAGIYALDNHIERLHEDHAHAKKIGEVLSQFDAIQNIRPIKTNIIIFDVKMPLTSASFLEKLALHGVKGSSFGVQTVRFVTHLDFTAAMCKEVCNVLNKMMRPLSVSLSQS